MQSRWRNFFVYLCLILGLTLIQNSWAATPPPLPTKYPPDIALIKKNGVLRVAFFKDGAPPFFMQDSKGNWSGIEVDLAQMIANELQVKLVIIPAATYNDIIDKITNGQADLGMGLINITPERELRVSFTDAYYVFHPHLLVNRMQAAKNGWTIWESVVQMQTTTKPFKLGALAGGVAGQLMQKVFPSAQPVPYPSIRAAMDDVVAGKIFAAVANSPLQVQSYLKSNPKAPLLAEDVEVTAATYLIGAAMPWQYLYFRVWLDLYLDYLEQNGLETQLFQKYNQPVEMSNEFSYP